MKSLYELQVKPGDIVYVTHKIELEIGSYIVEEIGDLCAFLLHEETKNVIVCPDSFPIFLTNNFENSTYKNK